MVSSRIPLLIINYKLETRILSLSFISLLERVPCYLYGLERGSVLFHSFPGQIELDLKLPHLPSALECLLDTFTKEGYPEWL